jgi:DNA polymerase kappa
MAAHEMTASEVVSHLRAEVEARIGLTISAGIAPNKMLAKICSDKNKPDGQFELAFEGKAIREFMRDLPIRRIPGIGRVAERYAGALGIDVCGDAYTHRGVVNLMDRYIGFKYLM